MLDWGKLNGRFDADYYSLIKTIKFNKTKRHLKVKKLFKIKDGDHSKFPEDEKAEQGFGIRYLRSQDIKDNGIISENPVYVSEKYYNTIKRSHIKPNDVVFSIMATLGSVATIPSDFEPATANRAVGILTIKSEEILQDYFTALFSVDYGIKLLETLKRGGIQQRINLQDLGDLYVPIPEMKDQLKIVSKWKQIKQNKKTKEDEAENLLSSINDYLLTELGIIIPTESDNTLENRIFYTPFADSVGDRLDPFYHKKFFSDIRESVKNCTYKPVELKQLFSDSFIKGYLPKEHEKDGENHVVQINSIDTTGRINLNELLTAKNVFKPRQKLIENDILVVITGATIGKVGFWSNNIEGKYYLGGDIIKFQVKERVEPYFVFSYLRTLPAQFELKRHITGATNGHLSPHDVKNMMVPLPPYEKQKEISDKIQQMREEAFRLMEEAEIEFEKAKQEVEKMILE